ncbi:thymidylate synthase [Novimethylophilus kurashikiensis]|uniref:thymidylate synthase n=1 Tax=Novimethylophilus kurashikiensis TaxID=1825523 RepID=A0A2R5F8Y4_9PROT|nr:thymidylate synthase [Novimethylophilus kurashikiensis]GBG14279.1 thymidylate synthase [Novimethylophilus kurashikiensis]
MAEAQMENFHEMLRHIMKNGVDQLNKRTGEICRAVPGYQLVYDLADGFPAITTKKLAFKQCKGELLGFFRGYQSAADFRSIGCTVWDANANETPAWLANRHRKGQEDFLGRIYGAQWTDWRDRRFVDQVERDHLLNEGFKQVMYDPVAGLYGMERSINQLENALRTILTNPSDRRIIVSGWNVAELDLMALPPCHVSYTLVPFEDTKELNIVLSQRSFDSALAFNVPMTAIFLALMARLSGYTPRHVVCQFANTHAYESHFEGIKEMLSREHFASPKLILSDNIKTVTLDEIPGAFARIEPDDIQLEGYVSHPGIKLKMAA